MGRRALDPRVRLTEAHIDRIALHPVLLFV